MATAARARANVGETYVSLPITAAGLLRLKDGLRMECHPGRTVKGDRNFYATAELKLVITATESTYYDAIQEALDRLAETLSAAQGEAAS